jgi:hypothetical protein
MINLPTDDTLPDRDPGRDDLWMGDKLSLVRNTGRAVNCTVWDSGSKAPWTNDVILLKSGKKQMHEKIIWE